MKSFYYIFILFLTLLFLFGCKKNNNNPTGPNNNTISIKVPADVPWFDSGVNVRSGEVIKIAASGTIYIGSLTNDSLDYQTPDGTPGLTPQSVGTSNTFLAPNLPLWSLIGHIDSAGNPFEIGEDTTFTAADGGELYLSVNDNIFDDNSGSWSVNIITNVDKVAIRVESKKF